MELAQVGALMAKVDRFCKGDASALDVAQSLGESYETILTLFTLTGVCDVNGKCCELVEPWRVMGTINLMYLMRANRSLRGALIKKR